MVLLAIGTGIGGGIVTEGALLRGSGGNGAELGHMIIVPEGRPCNCGQRGCLEAYSSAGHTAKRAIEGIKLGRKSSLKKSYQKDMSVSCKEVFEHARDGDELALEIVEGTTKGLAQACVNMRHITEPEMVVLGGGMSQAGAFLRDRVIGYYEEMIWSLQKETMEICLAQLGDEGGILGSANLASHYYREGKLFEAGS